jgi:hypothetical protein
MFQASSCSSSGATTTTVAASGLPLELGGSSAVGRGRTGRPDHDHDQQHHVPTVNQRLLVHDSVAEWTICMPNIEVIWNVEL